jgi:hypothetical protein
LVKVTKVQGRPPCNAFLPRGARFSCPALIRVGETHLAGVAERRTTHQISFADVVQLSRSSSEFPSAAANFGVISDDREQGLRVGCVVAIAGSKRMFRKAGAIPFDKFREPYNEGLVLALQSANRNTSPRVATLKSASFGLRYA